MNHRCLRPRDAMTSTFDVTLPVPAESTILVVDDVPRNIQVVASVLGDAGYEIMPATSGAQALDRVQTRLPDLILLDLMMPEMDGLETCAKLKAGAAAKVPVIFLTASNELAHLVKAFEAGAVDYVTKPFNPQELLARVATHLELKHSRDALEKQTQRLRQLNEEKNEYLGIAAHDLRGPLNNIIASSHMLLTEDDLDPEEEREMLQFVHQSAKHMSELVRNLLDVNAIEAGQLRLNPVACSLLEIVSSALDSHRHRAVLKEQQLEFTAPGGLVGVVVDPNATLQVVDNLVSNAIKYSPPRKSIQVHLLQQDGKARLVVKDHGPGLTPEDQKRLFGKFARLSAKPTGGEVSIGLGLSIVKKMVEASGGKVWCESEPGNGAAFIVEWPLAA